MADFFDDPLGRPEASAARSLADLPRKITCQPPIKLEEGPNRELLIRYEEAKGRKGRVVELIRIDGEEGEEQEPFEGGGDDECWWNAHSVVPGIPGSSCPPSPVSFGSPPSLVEQDEGKIWLSKCLQQDCKPKGGDLFIAIHIGRESACGPHAWIGTQCICCGESRVEIPPPCVCIEKFDICRVKVEFRGVRGGIYGDGQNGELNFGNNTPWPCVLCGDPPVQPCCSDTPGDCSEWVCSDSNCREWNKEWELFFVPELSQGRTFCVFAEGQAKSSSDTSKGYQRALEVYDVPGAGNTCFPCALVDEDTGIRMEASCINECLLDITIEITINGCVHALIRWFSFDPSFQPGETKHSREADEFNPDTNIELCGQPCYRPAGTCNDPDATFDGIFCANGDPPGIAWIYDAHNCRWTQIDDDDLLPIIHFYKCGTDPPYDNPTLCNPCPPIGAPESVQIPTDQWIVEPAGPPGSTATLIADPDARDGDAWSLCGGKWVTYQWQMPLFLDSPQCRICLYIRYKQTDPGGDGLTSTGTVRVDSIDGVVPVFEQYELEEHLTYDDPRVDLEFGGYWYRYLGCFWVESEQTLEFTVEGAQSPTDCLVFDDFVIKFN